MYASLQGVSVVTEESQVTTVVTTTVTIAGGDHVVTVN